VKLSTQLLTLSIVGSGVIAASACAGPGSGSSSFTEGNVKTGSAPGTTGDDDDSTSSSSSSSGGSSSGGDKIFGTKAFAYVNPGENADDHQATHTGQTPLEGKNCVVAGCHLDTKPWAAAGTVYADTAGSAPLAQAEIGIVFPDNSAISAMTDAQGNFWFDTTKVPPAGSLVGVRTNGSAPRYMAETITGPSGCNNATGCHGSATLRIAGK
jgi:hypothetical protein